MREVYTDGACRGNPGPGGWAWAVPHGPQAAGADPATTNQRMEVRAALEAVRALDGPLVVVSDSTYVVNCFRNRWWKGWHARGWINSQKRPVANRDLWEPLVEVIEQRVIGKRLRLEKRFEMVRGFVAGGERVGEEADELLFVAAPAVTFNDGGLDRLD